MPRPRRQPAPPGRVEIICTGRGDHVRQRVEQYLLVDDDGVARLRWLPRGKNGHVPVTGHRQGEEGWQTADLRCGRCRRHLKVGEERLIEVIRVAAACQRTRGEHLIVVDISVIERAL